MQNELVTDEKKDSFDIDVLLGGDTNARPAAEG